MHGFVVSNAFFLFFFFLFYPFFLVRLWPSSDLDLLIWVQLFILQQAVFPSSSETFCCFDNTQSVSSSILTPGVIFVLLFISFKILIAEMKSVLNSAISEENLGLGCYWRIHYSKCGQKFTAWTSCTDLTNVLIIVKKPVCMYRLIERSDSASTQTDFYLRLGRCFFSPLYWHRQTDWESVKCCHRRSGLFTP